MKVPAVITVLCLVGLAATARAGEPAEGPPATSAPPGVGPAFAGALPQGLAALAYPTLRDVRLTKDRPQSCTPPPATTVFASSDEGAWFYFFAAGFASGERLSVNWYSPDGNIAWYAQWDPFKTSDSGCYWAKLPIAGGVGASNPGFWRVRLISDKVSFALVDLSFAIGSDGGGGGGNPTPGTWLLTSSARVQGAGAFWRTDLSIRNTGLLPAEVTVKFLGHSNDGRGGPERNVTLAAGEIRTWRDVLESLFGLSSDYGPILVRSATTSLAILGQTWTAGEAGTYGQSVPVLASNELVGALPRTILGVRQDAAFRTNLMLANATEVPVEVDIQLVSSSGTVLVAKKRSLGPLSRDQLNVAVDFDVSGLDDGAFVVSTPTPGGAIGAYASLIDNGSQDPRTLLPR